MLRESDTKINRMEFGSKLYSKGVGLYRDTATHTTGRFLGGFFRPPKYIMLRMMVWRCGGSVG